MSGEECPGKMVWGELKSEEKCPGENWGSSRQTTDGSDQGRVSDTSDTGSPPSRRFTDQ